MSLPKRTAGPALPFARSLTAAALAAALAATSACTVQPLYGQGPAAGAGTAAVLSSIAIEPADTRFEQEVRNHLIFLFGGGAGQPANPAYSLELNVVSITQLAAVIQRADENEPTAGTVTLTANYRLTRTGTGEVLTGGQRQVTSPFDYPLQQFAARRAERDAQNRAARELAELIRLHIAQTIATS